MSSKLDSERIRKALNELAEGNKVTQAEHRARLISTSVAESLATFAALHDLWKRSGRRSGGNWNALSEYRVAHHIELRKTL